MVLRLFRRHARANHTTKPTDSQTPHESGWMFTEHPPALARWQEDKARKGQMDPTGGSAVRLPLEFVEEGSRE